MAEKVLKHFQVLTKSWINNAIHEGGSIASIMVHPDTFQPGPNLKELPDYEPKHSEAQQKAADEESARTEERVSKSAALESAPHEDEPVLPMPEPVPPPAQQPASH